MVKLIGEVKGKSFIVSGVGPQWQSRSVLKFAKYLRDAGVKSVFWYRGGMQELRGIPNFPPELSGAQVVTAVDVKKLHDDGVILTFIAPHELRRGP